jgi:hypothetical protein
MISSGGRAFQQITVGTSPQGFKDALRIVVSGQDHQRRTGQHDRQGTQAVLAGNSWEVEVHQNDIRAKF